VVDPIPDEDRARTLRWVKVGAVLLVGLSAGLIAVQGGASPDMIAVSVAAGLLVGGTLVRYLAPDADAIAPATERRYRE
jgi:xanthosine utilization system XapX-like protein